MSLLNEMLRDLHQRQALPVGVPGGMMADVATVDEGDAGHRRRLPWQWLVLAVLAVAAAAAGYTAAPHLTGRPPPAVVEMATGTKARPTFPSQPHDRSPQGNGHTRTGLSGAPVSLRMGASLKTLSEPRQRASRGSRSRPVHDGQEAAPVQVAGARLVQSAHEAVVVLDLERAVEFRVFALDSPPRLVLDIPQATGWVPTRGTIEGHGPVQRVRSVSYGDDFRLVLDLAEPVSIRRSVLEENGNRGHRLILELIPVEPEPVVTRDDAESESDSVAPVSEQSHQSTRARVEGRAAGTMTKTAVHVDRREVAESQYRKAAQLLSAGRRARGEALLREALTTDPTHEKARELLGARLLSQHRYGEAARTLLEGLNLRPADVRLHSLYARLLVERGEPEQAIAVLKRVSPPLADEPEYHAFQAALLHKTGRHDQAAELYRELVQLRPRAGVWWMGLAMALEAGGESGQALAAYAKASDQSDMPATLLRFVKERIQHLQGQPS